MLGNVDIDLPDSVDSSFIKFVQNILGIMDSDIKGRVWKLYNSEQDPWIFHTSETKWMITMIKLQNSQQWLLVKGNLKTLFL